MTSYATVGPTWTNSTSSTISNANNLLYGDYSSQYQIPQQLQYSSQATSSNNQYWTNNYVNDGFSSTWNIPNNSPHGNSIKIRISVPENFQKNIPLDINIETKLPIKVRQGSSQSGNKEFPMQNNGNQSMEMTDLNVDEKEQQHQTKDVHGEANTSSQHYKNERRTPRPRKQDSEEESETPSENVIWTSNKAKLGSKVYGVDQNKRKRNLKRIEDIQINSTEKQIRIHQRSELQTATGGSNRKGKEISPNETDARSNSPEGKSINQTA